MANTHFGPVNFPTTNKLGPTDVLDFGALGYARYVPLDFSDPHNSLTCSNRSTLRQGKWVFGGHTLGADDHCNRQQSCDDERSAFSLLGPSFTTKVLVTPAATPPQPWFGEAETNLATNPLTESIRKFLHINQDIRSIPMNLLVDETRDSLSFQDTASKFGIDNQANLLGVIASLFDPSIQYVIYAVHSSVHLLTINTATNTSNMLCPLLSDPCGHNILELSASPVHPLQPVIPSNSTRNSPRQSHKESILLSVRTDSHLSMYNITIKSFVSREGVLKNVRSKVIELDRFSVHPNVCFRIRSSPFGLFEALIATNESILLWQCTTRVSVRSVFKFDNEMATIKQDPPSFFKNDPAQSSLGESDIEEDSDEGANPGFNDNGRTAKIKWANGVAWSASPRFAYIHNGIHVHMIDIRQPTNPPKLIWSSFNLIQSAARLSSPLNPYIPICSLECSQDYLLVVAGARTYILNAKDPIRIGCVGVLGFHLSQCIKVLVHPPILISDKRGLKYLYGSSSVLDHDTFLSPFQVWDNDQLHGLLANCAHQPIPPFHLFSPFDLHKNFPSSCPPSASKHKFPTNAPLVGFALVPQFPTADPQSINMNTSADGNCNIEACCGHVLVIHSFADGTVVSRKVPVTLLKSLERELQSQSVATAHGNNHGNLCAHDSEGNSSCLLHPPMPPQSQHHFYSPSKRAASRNLPNSERRSDARLIRYLSSTISDPPEEIGEYDNPSAVALFGPRLTHSNKVLNLKPDIPPTLIMQLLANYKNAAPVTRAPEKAPFVLKTNLISLLSSRLDLHPAIPWTNGVQSLAKLYGVKSSHLSLRPLPHGGELLLSPNNCDKFYTQQLHHNIPMVIPASQLSQKSVDHGMDDMDWGIDSLSQLLPLSQSGVDVPQVGKHSLVMDLADFGIGTLSSSNAVSLSTSAHKLGQSSQPSNPDMKSFQSGGPATTPINVLQPVHASQSLLSQQHNSSQHKRASGKKRASGF